MGEIQDKPKANKGQRFLHPLMVDLILEKIIHLLDVESLKSVRHVCKRWKAFTSEAFVSKTGIDLVHVMNLGELDDLFELVKNGTCEPLEQISLTLEAVDKAESVTLGKIVNSIINPLKDSIESLHFHACLNTIQNPSSSSPILARILMLPSSLKSLSLSVLPRLDIDNLIVFLKNQKKCLPLQDLKVFRIYGRCVFPDDFLELLFADMSNLKTLILKDVPIQTTEVLLKLIIKFNLKSLTDLRFDGISFLQRKQIEELANLKLQLEHLKIDFSWFWDASGPQEYVTKCYLLLESTSTTLKSMHVNHMRDRTQGLRLIMPHLPQLTNLRLDDWSDFGPITFLHQLPTLKILSLHSRLKSYKWINPPIPFNDFFPPVESIFPELNELELFQATLPDESFKIILNMFPNLKRLSMKGTDSLLQILYRISPGIQDLTLVRESQITDYGITGIFTDVLPAYEKNQKKRMSASESSHFECVKNYMDILELGRISIKNLTNLRRLQIDGYYSQLTDASVLYGVKLLKNLTSLSLTDCELTPDSLKELETMPLMYLDVTNSLAESKNELWKIVVITEVAQIKIRKPFLHLIAGQDQEEENPFDVICDLDEGWD